MCTECVLCFDIVNDYRKGLESASNGHTGSNCYTDNTLAETQTFIEWVSGVLEITCHSFFN